MKPLRYHPEADREVEAEAEWYEFRSAEAAELFVLQLGDAIERIAGSPAAWPTYLFGTRRALLHKFPLSVVYREQANEIQIIAIAHAKRRPG